MGLRVKVKICYNNKCVEENALLNTGFETDEPVVSLPVRLAENLGLNILSSVEFEDPGFTKGTAYFGDYVMLEVSLNNESRGIKAKALITPGEEEAIVSDKCIEELGLVLDLRKGKVWFT
ncbi:MAG: hypothetical protein B6U76_05955 [Desulfurococcales archaeon ex4484_217_2]|nr:MAG: hypothetical protein B6U76_05955 [Desulfurococcales archaeon ex4484_217_2]